MADVADDARALIDAGDTDAARAILEPAVSESTRPAVTAKLKTLLAECLILEDNIEDARPLLEQAKTRNLPDTWRWLGYLDFLNYDFSAATADYAQYTRLMRDAKKSVDEEALAEQKKLTRAIEFLENVENIQIIDSITVPTQDFFTHYRLPASAGFLTAPASIPFPDSAAQATMAFSNENGDLMMWAETDSLGTMRIAESMRLTDGSWSTPLLTPEELNGGADADYPFLMADGQTLYFCNDGEESIGGYDIFVAMRDPSTGEYLQPRNLGMPYNSPADDYMMAFDEENGVGWWATDRNRIPGMTTIYLFIPNELRLNIDPEEQDPVAFARIDNIAATQRDAAQCDAMRRLIADITPSVRADKPEFIFPLGHGRVACHLEDFSPAGQRMYLAYKEIETSLSDTEAALRAARTASSPSAAKISRLEEEVVRLKTELKQARNNVYRAEGQK